MGAISLLLVDWLNWLGESVESTHFTTMSGCLYCVRGVWRPLVGILHYTTSLLLVIVFCVKTHKIRGLIALFTQLPQAEQIKMDQVNCNCDLDGSHEWRRLHSNGVSCLQTSDPTSSESIYSTNINKLF